MNLSFTVQSDKALLTARLRCLDYLRTHSVSVGLPASAPDRSRFLLALHEHGSPLNRIPARPVLRPALSQPDTRQQMGRRLLAACQQAARGDLPAVQTALASAGQAGVDGIHSYLDAGVPPPNAPVTLQGGWIRNRVSGRSVHVPGKSGDKPLIDTGALYHSFGFEITRR